MPEKDQLKSYRRIIIILAVLLGLSLVTFIIVGVKQSIKTTQLISTIDEGDSLRRVLETRLNLAESNLNSLEITNDSLDKQYRYYRNLVKRLRIQIRNSVSKEQLKEANERIGVLENELLALREENEKLKGENQSLTKDKEELAEKTIMLQDEVDTLASENTVLTDKVKIANTLMVGNFALKGIKISNGIQKETYTAKKISVMRFNFEVLENRVTEANEGDFYFSLIGPDGALIKDANLSGKISLADGTEVEYGHRKSIPYTPGERSPQIYDILPPDNTKFQPGNYTAAIYNNGYKVAQASIELKKGFLFF